MKDLIIIMGYQGWDGLKLLECVRTDFVPLFLLRLTTASTDYVDYSLVICLHIKADKSLSEAKKFVF
jgi:hypothetical protein